MHSLAMAQDILKVAFSEAKKHRANKIKAISVKVGNGDFAESDSLQFCLEATAKGTIADEAQIDVEFMDTATKCFECGLVFPVEDHLPVCPRCGNKNPEMLADEELPHITLELG
jgi:hydrogenase nickel incorporation protein HypA/HybF